MLRVCRFVCLLVAGVLCPAGICAQTDWKAAADSLGIKRVLVPSTTKVADLIDSEGTLVEVPLAQFAEKLQRIAQLRSESRPQPRLVKSIYRAQLIGNSLANGSANWSIDQPGPGAAIFSIASMNLAIQRPKLGDDRAILGDLDGGNLGLWLEKPGNQSLSFDWTLRGTPGVGGVAFEMKIPPCPLVTVELKLPADQSLISPKGTALVTGPSSAGESGFKLWKLHVAGRSQVEFLVRRGAEAGNASRLFASNETRLQLSPEHTVYDFDSHIEVIRAPISELILEIDPTLQPFEISTRHGTVDKWNIEPAKGGKPAILRVHFREPVIGSLGGLRIRATGPRWTNQEMSVPRIDVVDAVNRGESLKIHLHPDQHLERWDAGSYRLVNSATEKDGSQTLSVFDTDPDGKGVRPRFLVRTEGVDFTVMQETRWRIDPSGMSLSSDIQYDLSRGQLFSLEVRLPKNTAFRVANVDLQPRDALQKWDIAGGILRVDLQRGITPRTDVKLTVQLQDTRDRASTETRTLDFPDLEPLGANSRQGILAILADAHQRVVLLQSNSSTSRPDAALVKDPKLRYYFTFRQTPVTGKIRLFPQQPVLQARTLQTVAISPDTAKVKADITVEPVVGQPTLLHLFLAGSGSEPWRFEAKDAELVKKDRLLIPELTTLGLGLGATNSPMVAAARLLEPRGQLWRIHFRDPVTKSVTLTASQDLSASRFERPGVVPPTLLAIDHGIPLALASIPRTNPAWRVPIVIPIDAERVAGELLLQPQGAALASVQLHGFDAASGPGSLTGSFARLLRFQNTSLFDPPTLRVRVDRSAVGESAQAIFESAELTTTVDPVGSVSNLLRMKIWNWRAKEFRVTLPPESTVVAGRLNHVDFDRIPQKVVDRSISLELPMSQDAGVQTLELIYQTPSASWLGAIGRDALIPLPKFPLAPLTIRREVRLAAGWLPLHQEHYFSFDRQTPARTAIESLWKLGRDFTDEFFPAPPPAWLEQQRLAILGSEVALRRGSAREIPLGEAIANLIYSSKTPFPLTLDRDAMRRLELSPNSSVILSPDNTIPFWDSLGLAYLATPHAALLTTKDRAAAWQSALREGNSQGAHVRLAVQQAFERGQDPSGHFCAADEWLRSETPTLPASLWLPPSFGDFTLWQPIAGEDTHKLRIIRHAHIRGAAIVLAFVTLVVGFVLNQTVSMRLYFCCAWVALLICLIALAAAPFSTQEMALGPLAASLVLLAIAYRRLMQKQTPASTAPPRPSRSTQNALKSSLGVISIVAIGTFGFCHAQVPDPKVVFLTTPTNGSTAKALVRPGFLRWLDEELKPAVASLEQPVFLSARYQGRWDDGILVTTANFDVFVPTANAALFIPISGVDLLDGCKLNDRPAFPVVAGGGKVGYRVAAPGIGFHSLSLSFVARRDSTGVVNFSVPPIACASLQVAAPLKDGKLRLVRSLGETVLRVDPKASEQILDAQLGRESTIQIEGLTPAHPATAELQVRELYSWDLRLGHRAAHGLLSYEAAGDISQIEVKVPATLEIRSVELVEQPNRSAAIRSWRTVPRDGSRMLQVDFLQPLTGSFQVMLTMTPRWSTSNDSVELRLPQPQRAVIVDGMIGLRVDEPDAIEKAQFLGVAAVSPDAFVKEWMRLGHREIDAPLHAFSFARSTKNAAAAAIDLTPLPSKPRVSADVFWTTYPTTIDLAANLNVSSTDDMHLVPVQLSESIVLRDVQGPDIHHWSRNGALLQVWLIGPRKKTSLTLVGWVPHHFPKTNEVALPHISVKGATFDPSTLAISSASGVALEPVSVKGLVEMPTEGSARRFRVNGGAFPTNFRLRPQASSAEYETLTTAEVHDAVATIATHIHGRVSHGDFPGLQFRVVDWPTPSPRLIVPFANAKVKHTAVGSDHTWTVSLPPGTPQHVSIAVVGKAPLGPGKAIVLPRTTIDRGGQLIESIVATAGCDTIGLPGKLASVRSSTKELATWPLERARLRAAGAQFARTTADAAVTISAKTAAAAPSAQILSAKHRVVVGGDRLWLHQMAWSVWAIAGIDLDVNIPPGATFAASLIDDQPATPRQTGPDVVSLSLSASLKSRIVLVAWTYPDDKENTVRPRLTQATLRGFEAIAVHGTLNVPAGWTLAQRAWVVSETDLLLNELKIHAHSLQVLIDDLPSTGKIAPAPVVQLLQSFAATARQTQYRIAFLTDPKVRAATEQSLQQLVDDVQKRCKNWNVESARIAAEKAFWTDLATPIFTGTDSGLPASWLESPTAASPQAILHRTGESVPYLIPFALALAVLGLSLWTSAIRVWAYFWPEQLALATSIGFSLGGFSLVGVALLAFALAGRLLNLSDVARRFARRPRTA